MAKNKKAQILAAVMCATTVVGVSPAISSADEFISDTDGIAYVATHDNSIEGYAQNDITFTVGNNTFAMDQYGTTISNGTAEIFVGQDALQFLNGSTVQVGSAGTIFSNNGTTTTINGNAISTGSLTADSTNIAAGTFKADSNSVEAAVGNKTLYVGKNGVQLQNGANNVYVGDNGTTFGNGSEMLTINGDTVSTSTGMLNVDGGINVKEGTQSLYVGDNGVQLVNGDYSVYVGGNGTTFGNGTTMLTINGNHIGRFNSDGSFTAGNRQQFSVGYDGTVNTTGDVISSNGKYSLNTVGEQVNTTTETLNEYKEAGIVAGTVKSNTFGSIALGNVSYVGANQSIALGENAIVNDEAYSSVALGNSAGAYAANSVALGANSIANRENAVSVGSENHERQIVNVAAGTEDTDAVNLKQLKDVQSGVDKTFDEYKEAGIVAGTSTVDNDVVMGDGSYNTGEYGVVIGKDASNTGFGSMAIGAHTMVSGENSIALGFGSQATENNVVSVGGYASGTQRRIINVADGINDSDAATVGQLKEVSQKVEETSGNVAGIDRVENEDGTHTTVINEDTSIKGDLNVDGTLTVGGEQIATSGDVSAVTSKVNEVSTKVDAVDAKVGDTSKLNSEVAVNGANTSLVDAINAETTMRQQLSGRVDGLEGRVGSLEDRMGDVEDRIDKVGAMAAAIANLRTMGYDPEAPTEIAVGVGQYESETGLALGVFHYPNEDFMLSASISTSGDEVMGGIGATWKIGRKSAAEKERTVEEKRVEKAEEMQDLAKKERVNAQRERHAKMLAERQQQEA